MTSSAERTDLADRLDIEARRNRRAALLAENRARRDKNQASQVRLFSKRAVDLEQAVRLLREPVAGEVEAELKDPNVVHLNMLRGGIAKPTPEQIGHLYRGDEAVRVVTEVRRQNPDAFEDQPQ